MLPVKNEVTRVKKRLHEYKKTHPEQLILFQKLLEEPQFSRTIELYDAIPKYVWGKVRRENGVFLYSVKRQFRHKGKEYSVIIKPARIVGKDGKEKDFFPGKREELVEDALRKLACERKKGVFLDNEAGVLFSLYELQKELQRTGHTYSLGELRKAISICNSATIELFCLDDDSESVVSSPLFEMIGLNTRKDWKTHGKNVQAYVKFNTLVTRSIRTRSFRQLDYEKCMAYKNSLARWLHKRMSHNFVQAGKEFSYSIKLSTIIRDSGVKPYVRLRDNLKKVREAFDEMKAAHVLAESPAEVPISGDRKNKLDDVKFTLTPHNNFIREVIKTNTRFRRLRHQQSEAIAPHE